MLISGSGFFVFGLPVHLVYGTKTLYTAMPFTGERAGIQYTIQSSSRHQRRSFLNGLETLTPTLRGINPHASSSYRPVHLPASPAKDKGKTPQTQPAEPSSDGLRPPSSLKSKESGAAAASKPPPPSPLRMPPPSPQQPGHSANAHRDTRSTALAAGRLPEPGFDEKSPIRARSLAARLPAKAPLPKRRANCQAYPKRAPPPRAPFASHTAAPAKRSALKSVELARTRVTARRVAVREPAPAPQHRLSIRLPAKRGRQCLPLPPSSENDPTRTTWGSTICSIPSRFSLENVALPPAPLGDVIRL